MSVLVLCPRKMGKTCPHTHTHIQVLENTHSIVCCVQCCCVRACSSSSIECYVLLSVCVTGPVTRGLIRASYHWDRQQPPGHTHTHTCVDVHTHMPYPGKVSVRKNLQTIKEMVIWSSQDEVKRWRWCLKWRGFLHFTRIHRVLTVDHMVGVYKGDSGKPLRLPVLFYWVLTRIERGKSLFF